VTVDGKLFFMVDGYLQPALGNIDPPASSFDTQKEQARVDALVEQAELSSVTRRMKQQQREWQRKEDSFDLTHSLHFAFAVEQRTLLAGVERSWTAVQLHMLDAQEENKTLLTALTKHAMGIAELQRALQDAGTVLCSSNVSAELPSSPSSPSSATGVVSESLASMGHPCIEEASRLGKLLIPLYTVLQSETDPLFCRGLSQAVMSTTEQQQRMHSKLAFGWAECEAAWAAYERRFVLMEGKLRVHALLLLCRAHDRL
jgi:hypothetical protein